MSNWASNPVTVMLQTEWGLSEAETKEVFDIMSPLIDDRRMEPWDTAMAVAGFGEARVISRLSPKQKAFAVFWCGYIGGAAHADLAPTPEALEALEKRYNAIRGGKN